MKTQQECWEALVDGEILECINDPQNSWKFEGGMLVPATVVKVGVNRLPGFIQPENWRIKPKKLPFVEALRALVNGECRVIGKECGTQIAGHSCFDELLPSDFDAEWELVK